MKMTYSKNIVLPEKFSCELSENGLEGRFYIYPLQKGFGITIGNIFRRVLLSSIKGVAFWKINIPFINHECSTINGIKQDLSHVIYNLKKIVIKSDLDVGSAKIVISEARVYTAKDIIFDNCINTSIVNHEVELFEVVDLDTPFEIILYFQSGVGDLFVENISSNAQNYGDILIDAHFSPVTNVSFFVEETRVLDKNDYDKVCIEIKTNGSINPKIAMEDANTILFNFISSIAEIKNDIIIVNEDLNDSSSDSTLDYNLFRKISDIDLSVRAFNCLHNEGIECIGDLVIKPRAEMLKAPNLGKKSLIELEEILKKMGYSFDMSIPNWQQLRSDQQVIANAQKFLQDL